MFVFVLCLMTHLDLNWHMYIQVIRWGVAIFTNQISLALLKTKVRCVTRGNCANQMSCWKLHVPVMTFCKVLVTFALDPTWLPEGQPPSSSKVHPRTLSCFCVNIGTQCFYSQNLWINYFWNLMFYNTLPKYEYPGSVLALWEECGIMWGRAQVRGVCRMTLNWLFGKLSFTIWGHSTNTMHLASSMISLASFTALTIWKVGQSWYIVQERMMMSSLFSFDNVMEKWGLGFVTAYSL